MDCDSSEDAGDTHQPRPAWVKVQADEYTATVSTGSIFAAHPASLLASLIDIEFSKQQTDPCVRLDCSAEVARVRLQRHVHCHSVQGVCYPVAWHQHTRMYFFFTPLHQHTADRD
jgi:hypothetical protein